MLAVASRAVRKLAPAGSRTMAGLQHTGEMVQRPDTTAPVMVFTPHEDVPHTATVFFMHGLGDSCHGWADIVVQFWLAAFPHVKFVLPTAPQRPVTINGGFEMNAWYDIERLTDRDHDCDGIDDSRAYINTLMQEEVLGGIPHSRQVISGFSQGGALSLFTGLTASPPVAGVGVLSGYLPLPEVVKTTSPPSTFHVPVWFGHGKDDEVVLLKWGEASRDTVKDMGLTDVSWNEYRHTGHEANPTELADFTKWLARVLPDTVSPAEVAEAAEAQAQTDGLKTTPRLE